MIRVYVKREIGKLLHETVPSAAADRGACAECEIP